jgi:hypothetical protein
LHESINKLEGPKLAREGLVGTLEESGAEGFRRREEGEVGQVGEEGEEERGEEGRGRGTILRGQNWPGRVS